ncbi:alpha/beta hydrolase [Parvibaculum sp.]|uniref:alpha/beta fold hydrolase n=1 Tax=Parvibaculum sp. TaxID=2024848 RepID=UPI001B1B277C|nr:alpha/beta hydrolase [Parvibaculum sp.]MBO6634226.1 alpha/beta hydrolase [Parvibaculum sp.]MBO6679950.1 alpha/beta hydrolase [Parvibaculum sp.]MBO6683514.1 alpha/beta hydrolase [Parvibaculum sp.]MBO6905035.1 alpha/beta hydrolase [Parvibaculum sp.]
MEFFETDDGVRIAYAVAGEGSPVVLAHGFASTHAVNWVATGWAKVLTGAGYRVIMPDMRGHGESGKSHDKADYTLAAMAGDLVALLDHLGEPGADLMGYSMGAMAALVAGMEYPDRFDRIVAAGVGARLLDPKRDPGPVIEALLTEDPSGIEDKSALLFRTFADQNKQDREALAACFEAVRAPFPVEGLGGIRRPVLVVAGETDVQAGAPGPLAERIPGGEAAVVPKRDHMKTVGDRGYKEAVLKFLGG